ncbi:MAG: hypothetical protein JWM76_1837 [Pseudonocardiales bacterium]|nr:hypothetical protein [Pseudonocardiales bacterium]
MRRSFSGRSTPLGSTSAVVALDSSVSLNRVPRPFATWGVWAALTAWSLTWAAAHGRKSGYGWHYFSSGAGALFSGQGLHIYAQHRELQIGPVALVAAAPFSLIAHGTLGQVLAMSVMISAGLYLLLQVRGLVTAEGSEANRKFVIAGLLFIPIWIELAIHWAHLDDVLALLFGVVALRAAWSDRFLLAAALAALAADSKPWAVGFGAIVLLSLPCWRRPATVYVSIVALAWLPFYLADHRTLAAGSFKIPNDRASVIRLFGIENASTPSWCRPAQILLIILVAVCVAKRGRGATVILVVVAARLLLDPGTKNYYDAGLATGAVIFDLSLTTSLIPWLTLTTAALFWLPSYLLSEHPTERAWLRAVVLVGFLVVAFVRGSDGGTPTARQCVDRTSRTADVPP